MKILNIEQIRAADTYTIQHEPISSIDLMERAASAFARWFMTYFPLPQPTIEIVAATGNNGGDGLCVARILQANHYNVKVTVLRLDRASNDFAYNENLLKKNALYADIICKEINKEEYLFFDKNSLIIDALFGSGLTRPLSGLSAAVVKKMNDSQCPIIAIDMPSGLFADKESTGNQNIVRAQHTVSFELPKLAFMLPENYPFVGQWHIVPIGLHAEFIAQQTVDYHYFTAGEARKRQKITPKFAHKGTRGHVLFVGGSYGKIGAAALSVRATLKAGAGLATAYIPQCGYTILQSTVPEAMVITPSPSDEADYLASYNNKLPDLQPYSVLALGPGLGTNIATHNLVKQLLLTAAAQKIPLVIDADALNIIAFNEWQDILPPNSILTPHPKEFERLAGVTNNHFDRLEKLRACAKKWSCYIVLKGAHTAIACPAGRVFFNSSGNQAMATGGSGDALTGIIAALRAQGYSPENSALLGVFRHGAAGDKAALNSPNGSISAWDIVACI